MKPTRPKCILNFGSFAATAFPASPPLENTDKTSHFRVLSDAIPCCEGDSQFVPGLRAQCGGGGVAASSEAPQNKMHNTLKEDADNGALSKQTQSWKLSHNIKPHLSVIFLPDCPSVQLVLTFVVQVEFYLFFCPPPHHPPPSITVTVTPV